MFSLRPLSILSPRRFSFLYVPQNPIHYLLHKKPIIVPCTELVKSTSPRLGFLKNTHFNIIFSFASRYSNYLRVFLLSLPHSLHTSHTIKQFLCQLPNHHKNIRCWLRSSTDNFRVWRMKTISSFCKRTVIVF